MADTKIQGRVHKWIRNQWLPAKFSQPFHRAKVKLTSGGGHSFSAVSSDGKIVATISTSNATTASGKRAVGKLMKVRADLYFLLMVEASQKLVICTERDMYDLCREEEQMGRIHPSITFLHVPIPPDLQGDLDKAKQVASDEVSPNQE